MERTDHAEKTPQHQEDGRNGSPTTDRTVLFENPASGTHEPPYRRQAIVVIHGMGEQRPVETLNEFSSAITDDGRFHSRPTKIDGAFEARMHVVPRSEPGADGLRRPFDTQTDIFEYHWAHLMQGNRLDDLWPTVRRMIFPVTGAAMTIFAVILLGVLVLGIAWQTGLLAPPPNVPEGFPWVMIVAAGLSFILLLVFSVPPGLIGLWLIVWGAVVGLVFAFMAIPAIRDLTFFDSPAAMVTALLAGTASSIAIVAYLISRVLPGWLVKSFVDVVRYLDTSPRSYEVRLAIRKGIVDLLDGLQQSGKYSRIVVTAHSLGSYIGYDAISYLWTVRNKEFTLVQADVDDIEAVATALADGWEGRNRFDFRKRWASLAARRAEYRREQRALWQKLRAGKHPWIITDFVTFGSPMNFADRLFTRSWTQFDERIARRELVTCPPVSEDVSGAPSVHQAGRPVHLTWAGRGEKRRLHEAAPFAVVRWTNLWYPALGGFFGDWFGGPLARLYGPGVEDVRLDHATGASWVPGYAHTVYLREGSRSRPKNRRKPGSFGEAFEQALDLCSAEWLPKEPMTPPSVRGRLRLSGDGRLRPNGDGGMDVAFEVGLEFAERATYRHELPHRAARRADGFTRRIGYWTKPVSARGEQTKGGVSDA